MNVEVLVSTMNLKDLSLIQKMNINSSALIINQCNIEDNLKKYKDIKNNTIKLISFNEKGLSKSRNRALENALGDICVFADDDVIFDEGYEQTVVDVHKVFKEYDVIAFVVPRINSKYSKRFYKKIKKINLFTSMKISSVEITIKRQNVLNKGIKFNEFFGTGSQYYSMGEENIFLIDCLKKGLKILFVPKQIAKVDNKESTWFKGFNDKYFFDKGAVFCAMSEKWSILLILQFAIRKYKLYKKNLSIIRAIKLMLAGRDDYKKIKNTNSLVK